MQTDTKNQVAKTGKKQRSLLKSLFAL